MKIYLKNIPNTVFEALPNSENILTQQARYFVDARRGTGVVVYNYYLLFPSGTRPSAINTFFTNRLAKNKSKKPEDQSGALPVSTILWVRTLADIIPKCNIIILRWQQQQQQYYS